MQGRAQWIAGDELLPQPRGEFVDAAGRVLAHTLQDIDQIIVGIDLVQPAGHDQTLHDPDVLGPKCGKPALL
jgi:hypothetical protein